jgi:hypothetical protein
LKPIVIVSQVGELEGNLHPDPVPDEA